MSGEGCKEALKTLFYIHLMTLDALKESFKGDVRFAKEMIILASVFAACFIAMRIFIPDDRLLLAIGFHLGVMLGMIYCYFNSRINLNFVKNLLREWSKEAEKK